MSRLTVVRHGNTFERGEPPRRVGSRTDLPLTAAGEAQAEALGRHFADRGDRFDRALSSGLRRTRSTAEAILRRQPGPPALELAEFLAEVDHGPDENHSEEEVVARIGADALLRWDRDASVPPGWVVDPERRIAAWRRLVLDTPADAAVLLVTSNGAARFALIALGLDETGPGLKLRTGAYGIIEIGLDGSARLVDWDRRPE